MHQDKFQISEYRLFYVAYTQSRKIRTITARIIRFVLTFGSQGGNVSVWTLKPASIYKFPLVFTN